MRPSATNTVASLKGYGSKHSPHCSYCGNRWFRQHNNDDGWHGEWERLRGFDMNQPEA